MNGQPDDNRRVISVVTFTIALAFIMCVSAIISLAWNKQEIPPELNTLTGALGGYLTGALTKTTPTASTPVVPTGTIADPTHTEIVNEPINPVPITEEKTKK